MAIHVVGLIVTPFIITLSPLNTHRPGVCILDFYYEKIKQLSLFKSNPRSFGGCLLHGRRKSQRILSTKDAIHLVIRSSWAKGPFSFLLSKNKSEIERLLNSIANKYNVKIYNRAVVGNHLHLIIKISSRKLYNGFIRELSGRIATYVMRAQSFKNFKKYFFSQSEISNIHGSKHATTLKYWERSSNAKTFLRLSSLRTFQFD